MIRGFRDPPPRSRQPPADAMFCSSTTKSCSERLTSAPAERHRAICEAWRRCEGVAPPPAPRPTWCSRHRCQAFGIGHPGDQGGVPPQDNHTLLREERPHESSERGFLYLLKLLGRRVPAVRVAPTASRGSARVAVSSREFKQMSARPRRRTRLRMTGAARGPSPGRKVHKTARSPPVFISETPSNPRAQPPRKLQLTPVWNPSCTPCARSCSTFLTPSRAVASAGRRFGSSRLAGSRSR